MRKVSRRCLLTILVATIGLLLTAFTYFAPAIYTKSDLAVITDSTIKDTLVTKSKDAYDNKDETRKQVLHLKILSGKRQGHTFAVTNLYYPSQLVTQKYRAGQRLLVNMKSGKPAIQGPKRDWVLVLALTVMLTLMVAVVGKKSFSLIASMAVSWILFYFIIMLDIKLNGSDIVLLFGLADVVFSFFSLLIVQGFNRKMLTTWLATLLGTFVSFAVCYLIMRLTGESEIKYETGDYATQDPRGLFLAQTLLGILGAVMDEATDIVSSLHELVQTNKNLTARQLIKSGRTMGQEIMGPLINVLVLIFMSEELPLTILYLRDNNSLRSTFSFTLSLGVTQSVISAIGIVLTVVFATSCSLLFLNKKGDKK